ncbi:MAG: tetratricopeptide repeat protein [Candidatus Obscuribacterales bacterium]|nr:tetratricopeptide repeat protein [Candidatus Obscuribacterales bacterium]
MQKVGFLKINITATILVCGSFLLSSLSASAVVDQAKISATLTMGQQQRQLSHFGEAEQSFKSAIAMSEGGPVDVQARANEALGGLYMAMGRLQESQGLYEKSIRLLEGTNNKNLLGIAYDNMSRLCQERGSMETAETYNAKALAIFESQPTTSRIDLAKAYNNKGLLEVNLKKDTQAQASYTRALQYVDQAGRVSDPTLKPTIMDNLGGLYLKSGEFDRAEAMRKQAVSLFETTVGARRPETAAALMNLGAVYTHQQKFEQGLPYIKRALDIDEATLGMRHPTTVQIMKNYCTLLQMTHHDQELQTYLQHVKSGGH